MAETAVLVRPAPPEGFTAFKWKTRRDLVLGLSPRLCPICGKYGAVWTGGGWTDTSIATRAAATQKDVESSNGGIFTHPDWPFYRDHPSRYGTGRCATCGTLYWHDFIGNDGKDWRYYYRKADTAAAPHAALNTSSGSGMVPETGNRNLFRSQENHMAAKPNPGSQFDFSKLVSPTELAEGGGFGPTSFRGAVIGASYGPHRFTPKDGFRPDQDASYFMALHLKFRVDEVLDTESGYDPDDHPEGFDYPVKLGGKSLRYLFATNDTRTPAGISGGFEEQALLAQGRVEGGGVVNFTDPIEATRGRWLCPIPGIPEGKGKIEPKSGYNQMLEASAPAIAAVDPSEVVEHEDKKRNKILTLPANSMTHLAADGLPSGALYFLGLSGVWDTKKIPLEGLKDDKGNTQVQKVLFLTSYDGREDIPIPDGMGGAGAGAVAASGAEPKAGKKSASASAAAKKPEPAATSVAPPAAAESEDASSGAGGPDGDDLDSQVIRAILAELPISGVIKQKDLAMKVVPKFPAAERVNAGQAFLRVIKANTKETAQGLADMGMDGDVYFTYDEKTQSVERWAANA